MIKKLDMNSVLLRHRNRFGILIPADLLLEAKIVMIF
jgi:hypothetical protein